MGLGIRDTHGRKKLDARLLAKELLGCQGCFGAWIKKRVMSQHLDVDCALALLIWVDCGEATLPLETLHFMFFEKGLRPVHVARVDQDGAGGGYR